MKIDYAALAQQLSGECHYDNLSRVLYATDASVYRELPAAVVLPKTAADIRHTIAFAREHGLSIIPRAAGTSLAGQCVGDGIVVDVSKYMTRILEVNTEAGWVRVQPGVIRDELNAYLQPLGFFFGPNTSTANRAMIGGMVGNNSCGTTSLVYGSTRDHVLELKTILSDGSETVFHALDAKKVAEKCQADSLESQIYRQTQALLSDPATQAQIRQAYPKPSIRRRNTGYAVDLLLEMDPITPGGAPLDLCTLLCGSEGTLAFTTEIKIHIDPLPPPEAVVVCAHFHTLSESLKAVLVAVAEKPDACELMDKIILDLTKENIEQQKNRFFVEGDPAAVLMVEFRADTLAQAQQKADLLIGQLQAVEYGYAYPKVAGAKIQQVWELRKAGLGILANLPGDPKAVACIEDTAVAIADLPAYIEEFTQIMDYFGQQSVYYAHAGDGELHLRPILDLKKEKDRQLFYDITEETARLVKKYRGSLSGEHGDGRVRAAFIPLMIGEDNYELLRQLKQLWDPQGLFNPGKIVDAAPMNESLRYEAGQETPTFDTVFDFSATQGILRAAEKCNGSGDCRKLSFSGGTMCPSYRATRNEKDTTRGRANVLREFLTMNVKDNPFDHPEIREAMDLCLSCKGCTSECPSNVDMSTLKAEFLHQYYQSHRVPLRSWAIANIGQLNAFGSNFTAITNFFLQNRWTSGMMKSFLGVAPKRSLPPLHTISLRKWYRRHRKALQPQGPAKGKLYFFCDEFTNFNDAASGIRALQLLTALGYEVRLLEHAESGRAHISKGLLDAARRMAAKNVAVFKEVLSAEVPLLGLEPSGILSFRDEYPRLLRGEAQKAAVRIAPFTMMIDEFLAQEAERGHITAEQFHTDAAHILLHGHCHQKALSSTAASAFALSIPENYTVEVIPSGCCGMAGSFGYEKEHYDVSMAIGEQVLFPAVEAAAAETILAAPGTSCRHQIKDGTGKVALHPVDILWQAVRHNKED